MKCRHRRIASDAYYLYWLHGRWSVAQAKKLRGTRTNVSQAQKERGTRTNVARERKRVWLHQCRYLVYACTIAECNCVACHSSV